MKWMLKDKLILRAAAKVGDEWTLTDEIKTGLERLNMSTEGFREVLRKNPHKR